MSLHTTPDSYTKLLIHSDTSDGSTTFVDSSTSGHTITANGNASHQDTTAKFGATSMYFDGTGDYLEPQSTTLLDITSNSQSFTYDLWVYPTSIAASGPDAYRFTSLISKDNVYLSFGFESDGTIKFYTYDGSQHYCETSAGIMQTNQWQHIAYVSNGGTLAIYYNGVSKALNSTTLVKPSQTGGQGVGVKPKIGHADTSYSSDAFIGYMDEIRISDGIARWTGNFVPPNVPYATVDSDFVTSVRQLSHGWKGSEGGEIHHRSDKVIHAFKSSGIFHIPRPITCDIVVVGGGAAGSIDHGGGGGAGAIGYKTSYSLAAGRYAVTVGAGGVAGTGNHGTGNQSSTYARMFALSAPGEASSFGSLIVAYGGQGGQGCCGTATLGGGNFGCGGGALRCNSVTTTNKGTTTISATFLAYMSTAGTGANIGGGGGGAGAVGANSSTGTGGNGARPVTWADAWGTDTNNDVGGGYFAGGGAGGSHNDSTIDEDTLGGYGGGGGWGDSGFGNITAVSIHTGVNGRVNTGGGGTGCGNPYPNSGTSGAGGSGIVLIKYDT